MLAIYICSLGLQMVSKSVAILKHNLVKQNRRVIKNSQTSFNSGCIIFGEFDWHVVVVFQCCQDSRVAINDLYVACARYHLDCWRA